MKSHIASATLAISLVALFLLCPPHLFAQSGSAGGASDGAAAEPARSLVVPESGAPLVLPTIPSPTAYPNNPGSGEGGELLPGETDPTVLLRRSLADFNLQAIVVSSNPENNIAMLEYEGNGYTVRRGSRIGTKNGVVREITPNSVIVEEEGGSSENLVELRLPQ
jgi:type IV pilus assembly protein PilP